MKSKFRFAQDFFVLFLFVFLVLGFFVVCLLCFGVFVVCLFGVWGELGFCFDAFKEIICDTFPQARASGIEGFKANRTGLIC